MLLQLSAQSVDHFLYTTLATPTPIATQTTSAQVWTPAGGGWGNPAIVAAVITSVVSVVAVVYNIWHNRKIEREKNEQQRRYDQEKDEQQRRHDQEMEHFRRELDAQYREKEQEKQREEVARHAMLMAQNNVARAVAYRKALHVDPQISRLQILDMQQPLEVANIYVRVRVHEDAIVRYAIDPALATAAERRDPDCFFQARHHYLEQRVMTAVDPDTAIRKYRRCVVVGDPGAGKTTLLKYLTLTLADGKYPDLSNLPIHVELNAFVYSEERDVLDYAARRWEERYAFPQAEARSYMDTMLRDGKAILLLDALDETVVGEQPAQADASYQKAWDAIIRLTTRYPNARIVVTARKAGYQQHRQLDGFTVVEVMDFRQEDIRQFVENWFRSTQGVAQAASANDLVARLDRNPRIQALAANPLLLSLIVLVYEAQLDLPDRRAELYRECVDVLLAKWDAKRSIRRRRIFKPDQKRQLLAEVAWHFHQQGRRYVPERDLLTEIAHFLPALGLSAEDNGQVLQEIASENGLLKEQARGWYGFLHLTLQEYFAATAVNDQSRFATLVSQCADPWWEEVLLLYAGQTPDAGPLLLSLLGKDSPLPRKDDLFHTNLLMAGRCLASFPTIRQKDLREEVIERIYALFLQTSYSRLRSQTIEVLSMIGGDAITAQLVALVKDTQANRSMRSSTAWALRKLGERSVAQDLIGMLKDSQNTEKVRSDVARALGQLGERSVAQDLIGMLKDSQIDDEIRRDIAWALGWLGERSVVENLVGMLKDSQIADRVRAYIALALGELGERSMVPELVVMFKDSELDDAVRGYVALTLGKLGEQSMVPDLLELLRDPQVDAKVRRAITWALGQLGERSVVKDLVVMLKDNQPNDAVSCDIARALGKLGEESVVLDLVRILKDDQTDSSVRCSITISLGEIGERSVVTDLLELLKDGQIVDWVRCDIARTIGNLVEDKKTMKTCVSLLLYTPADVADAIYSALWDMSRRAEVTIVLQGDGTGETVEFVPWQSGVKG